MQQKLREWRVWSAILAGVAVVTAVVVSLVVLGAKDDVRFTATPYSDVIRFEAEGAASLEVRVFDLSGKELWTSGVVLESFIDWDRTNTWGESLANGMYIYSVGAWDSQGTPLVAKRGKIALLPGDKVQLQAAPATTSSGNSSANQSTSGSGPSATTYGPMAYSNTGDWTITGSLGVGTDAPETPFHVMKDGQVQGVIATYSSDPVSAAGLTFRRARGTTSSPSAVQAGDRLGFFLASGYDGAGWVNSAGMTFKVDGTTSAGNVPVKIAFETNANGYPRVERMVITPDGKVGIAAATPAGQLDVRNTADQPALRLESSSGTNLIEAYNTGSLVFNVERAGDVRAIGDFYGASFTTGGADVAEKINTSEWVEAGNVVEIDPEHPGFFCKSSSPYSRRVAGIISTSPGVVLGNKTDSTADAWDDNRPILAIAGRVPVRVSTENGPIEVGDLLVSSSTPGVAMKGSELDRCVGAVVGKALEPFTGTLGEITAQVTLR